MIAKITNSFLQQDSISAKLKSTFLLLFNLSPQ